MVLDRGFYKYDPITQKKENDLEMEQLIRAFSAKARPNIQIMNDQVFLERSSELTLIFSRTP